MNNKLLKKLEPFKIDYNNSMLKIENSSSFLNLSGFSIHYEVSKMSKVIESGKLSLAVKPGETKEFPFKIKSNLDENLPYYLNVYVFEKDHINSFNQILLKDESKITYHKELELNEINKLNFRDDNISFTDFKIIDLDIIDKVKEEKSNKSIDILYKSENYELLKYIMETNDKRLSLRYTYLTKSNQFKQLGYKIKFNKDKYNKIMYFGEGPSNSDRFLKLGIESLYSVPLNDENINRSNVRIVSLLDENNHGIRIEYADCLFNIQVIDNYLYILLRDEYSKTSIKENSEYSFETIIDYL